MSQPRSYLFVPGHRPDRFAKAAGSGAQRIILDLEDAVAPADKDMARQEVVRWLQLGGRGVVRINAADSHWFDADLHAIADCPGAEVMVPKAELPTMKKVIHYLVDRSPIALIETVPGLVQAGEIASMKGVARLAFGNIDFSTDARMSPTSPALDQARFQIAIVSRHAGLPQPIDGVTTALNDDTALEADIARTRDFGYGGKLCIHPRQVGVVNARFGPSEDELSWARGVLDAVSKGGEGASQFAGKMIDRPVVERARYLLAAATESCKGIK
ncbi:HpcH/HpaI aldolase/citrate lyase family protein [Rhizobium sp. SYY.PMSO]|uniref:HpcH/HpaI aldolase/citrate lyase family protein n=1 Tax=Rhizobium sp. SYY.PMSO TaxID=3382192 RepID=UPI00398FE7DD